MKLNSILPTETIALALDAVRSNKFRSFLTVLGIVVGVTTVVAVASLLTGQPIPTRDLSTRITQAASTPGSLLDDLRGRLERARTEPPGPRRAALLAALRYRIRVERETIGPGERDALARIEAETQQL